jgi:uncharacterized membrane protein YtjA (UPF0391 family)
MTVVRTSATTTTTAPITFFIALLNLLVSLRLTRAAWKKLA